jgi:methionyl-tRNA synthetase
MGLLGLHYNGFAVDLTPESSLSEQTKESSDQEPMLYCPVCSRRLTERKCKLLCEQCGYYMSCADYY